MQKERQTLKLASIVLNDGRLGWLPSNPRQWTGEDVERMAKSIQTDPDFLDDRPLLVTPADKGKFVVFGGNMRREGCNKLGRKDAPAVIYYPETEEDRQTIIRRAMLDNGSFGQWDFDTLGNEWDGFPLGDWGVPAWNTSAPSDLGLSTEGKEGAEGYDEFVDKFQQKLTTDDCYTPPAVYDAILAFVKTIADLKGKKIERPFVPGGDYEHYPYQPNSVVVDNPPFSILSQIVRFYSAKGIPFFIFGPALTLFTAADCDVTYIIADADIEYENGAKVSTGFITNLIPDIRVWVCPQLGEAVEEAQATEDKTKQGFMYPDNIVTAAILGKLAAHATELKIRKRSCQYINESDSAKEQGRGLYGGGFILSDYAAAERAAAERAAATRLNLSEREKNIIARLNEQDTD